MEMIEIKKSIERTKAIITFTILFLFLLIPSFLLTLSERIELFALSLTAFVIVVLFTRIRRLNYKLQLLSKNV